MFGLAQISGKILTIQDAAEKLNKISLSSGDFSGAMHIFNLEFPFGDAIISGGGCEGSIRLSSQEITEAEAI